MTLSFEQHDEYEKFKKNINSEIKKEEMTEDEINEWEKWAEDWKDGDGLSEINKEEV
jgi:hypothetical protein